VCSVYVEARARSLLRAYALKLTSSGAVARSAVSAIDFPHSCIDTVRKKENLK